jgi:hypothetical protein
MQGQVFAGKIGSAISVVEGPHFYPGQTVAGQAEDLSDVILRMLWMG